MMVTGVGVLDKAVAIVDVLEDGPKGLSGLVEATGMPRATAHRLALALERQGWLERDGDGRFALGPRLAELGAAAVRGRALEDAARPALLRLRDVTGESVQLYVARGDVRVCVVSLESPHSLRTIVPVGAALPMGVGSAGRVLGDDPTGEVSRRGWTQSVEERERGVASVSAPVCAGGRIVAAVSVSGPIERTSRTPGRKYAAAVVAAATEIGRALGSSAP
ncbi:MAG TPA: IclR family transcriptional regulator [Thermoleophilia bacterium]|nr:IclR family transcriptional regulator [Thermoleophilia bacterium]